MQHRLVPRMIALLNHQGKTEKTAALLIDILSRLFLICGVGTLNHAPEATQLGIPDPKALKAELTLLSSLLRTFALRSRVLVGSCITLNGVTFGAGASATGCG